MAYLAEFLIRLREEEFEVTQEFPPDCVPFCAGESSSLLMDT